MREHQAAQDGQITTSTHTFLRIKRADGTVDVEYETAFTETADHRPVSMRVRSQMGQGPSVTEYTFADREVRSITTTQDGRETVTTTPAPEGEWLTPAQTDSYVMARLRAGADEIVYRTLDPITGPTPVVTTMSGVERGTFEVGGREFEGYEYRVTTSEIEGVSSRELRDATGEVVQTDTDLGEMHMVMTRSTREAALGEPIEGPEMMVSTFVRPEGTLKNPRRAKRAVYLVSVPEGDLPDLPSTGSQAFKRIDARSARVTVVADHERTEPVADREVFLVATHAADCDDPEIERLTARALRGHNDRAQGERAERLRHHVFTFVKEKNLGTALGTASEVARSGEGDCTEHAVLLAAMLREAGIPSRVVAGLVYVEEFAGERGVFGYHMWTEALLGEGDEARWVDLDATFPPALDFDVTHIALTVSDLSDADGIRSLARMTPMLGRLEIKVELIE